jgi:hypothetical protein
MRYKCTNDFNEKFFCTYIHACILVQPYAKRALRIPTKTGREIRFRGLCLLTTAVKVNLILIFGTNQFPCKTGI